VLLPVLWVLALLVPLAGAQTVALDAQAIFEQVAPAVGVVRVFRDGSSGVGTAFVVDRSGVLVTASHVARGADRLRVEFGDADPLDATLIGYDARRDVAMLSVRPKTPLPSVEVIDSSAVKTGDSVVVIGTPRGRPRVMTTGAIRGTGATLPGLVPGIFLTFDATIAPGNSGGPLLNDRGQVIGVVVAIARRPEGEVGLATASSALRSSVGAMTEGARLERAWIGVSGGALDDVRPGRGARGVLVLDVIPQSPAARAGVRGQNSEPPGDVIVAVDGEGIEDWNDLLRVLGNYEPGQRVRLGLVRAGTYLEVTVQLEARP
jgi:serine protease Do